MDATIALLRIAARITAASAALVAREGDDGPIAAWGCDDEAARALLRVQRDEPTGGESLFATLPVTLADKTAAQLVLVAPTGETNGDALRRLVVEIGAICDPRSAQPTPDALDSLIDSIEHMSEPIAILRAPPSIAEPPTFVHVNPAFSRTYGFESGDVIGANGKVVHGPLTDGDRLGWLRERMIEEQHARAVVTLYTREATPVWTEITVTPLPGGSGRGRHFLATYRDVTSRKQFETALSSEKRKLQTTLAAIADAVITVHSDGRVEFINAAAQRLLGIDLVDAYGARFDELIKIVDDEAKPIDVLGGANAESSPHRGDGHLHTKAGMIDVAYVASQIDDENKGVVVVLRDVTTEHRIALRLSFEAAHDPLTGLPNRRAFLERLESAVHSARDHNAHHAVAFLDLDRFKIVNDRFGHATGDRLLREIARVMGRVVRGGDVLARIGGDEFSLLLSDCRIDDARRVAEKMRRAVESYRIEHDGEVLGVGISIGLAAIEAQTPGATQALADADRACYQAKAAGRNVVSG